MKIWLEIFFTQLLYVTKQNLYKKTFKHLKFFFQAFTYLGYSKTKGLNFNKWFSFSMPKTSFFLIFTQCSFSCLVWAHNLLETTRKQARFETPKFNKKKCNYIEMTRKEVTWVESVTNYNHKIMTCNKLIPNSKVSMCIQKLDRWKCEDY